jgi:hypothetical protein
MLKSKYYNSIEDMPAHNYVKICETNNLSWVLRQRGITFSTKKCLQIFENIQSQIIDMFGVSDHYQKVLSKKQQICKLNIDKIVNGDDYLETFIDIATDELKALETAKHSTSAEIKVYIEKYLGFKLNLHEITVVEYFTYLEQMNKRTQ